MLAMVLLFVVLRCCRYSCTTAKTNTGLYLDETFFMTLENYQVNAKYVTEAQYSWIARVVHSRSADLPHMCTAVCVDDRIFITAARCIYSLKIKYTTVIYQHVQIPALTFVLPSNPSKQAFDDIGFIVVEPINIALWPKVKLYDKKRTDDSFQWFADASFENYTVVGYATDKGIHRIKSPDRLYNLTELPVVINIELCSKLMTFYNYITGFRVPCYHSCDVNETKTHDTKCTNYHGVEGGALIDAKEILLGIATWGAYFEKHELPVGFATVNSNDFYSSFECAMRIRESELTNGNYQDICEKD